MVTVHRAFGFRFVVFSNDHSPPHVHALGPDGEAKVDLTGAQGPRIVWFEGLGVADRRRVLAEVVAHRAALLLAWEKVHGRA